MIKGQTTYRADNAAYLRVPSNRTVSVQLLVQEDGHVDVTFFLNSAILWCDAKLECMVVQKRVYQRKTYWTKKEVKERRIFDRKARKQRINKMRQIKCLGEEHFSFWDGIESQALFSVDVNHQVDGSTAEILASFSDQILSSFNQATSRAFTSLDGIGDVLTETMNNAASDVNAFMGFATNLLWIIPIVASVCYFALKPDKLGVALLMFSIVTPLLPSVLKPLIDKVRDFLKPGVESQSGFVSTRHIMHIVSFGTALLTLGGGTKVLNIFDDLEKKFKTYEFGNNKKFGMVTSVITTIEETINFILQYFGKDKVNIMNTGLSEVDAWCSNVSRVTRDFTLCEKEVDHDVVHELKTLRNQAHDLEALYRTDSACKNVLKHYCSLLDSVCRANTAAFAAANSVRVEPVCFALYGKPGTGKTKLCEILATAVMSRAMPIKKIESLDMKFKSEIFQQGSSEYWNGYCGQYTHVMDDFMQQVNAVGATDSDAMNLIRIVNTWMYPLNFADLENKGKNNFRSKFVMLTTNVGNMMGPVRKVVSDPDAVLRRLQHPYQIGVREEFRREGRGPFDEDALDGNKCAAYSLRTGEFANAWFFCPFDFKRGMRHGESISFDELVQEIVNDLKIRDQQFSSNQGPLANMIQKVMAERYAQEAVPNASDDTSCEIQSQVLGLITTNQVEYERLSNWTCVRGAKPYKHEGEFYYDPGVVQEWREAEVEEPKSNSRLPNMETIMREMRRTVSDFKKTFSNALFDPVTFVKERPILGTFLKFTWWGSLFFLSKLAMFNICKTLFGQEDPDIDSQVLDHKDLCCLNTKSDTKMDIQMNVCKNLFYMTVVNKAKGKYLKLGSVTGLTGRTFLIPNHYFPLLDELIADGTFDNNSLVSLRNVHNKRFDVEFPLPDFVDKKLYKRVDRINEDVSMIQLPCALAVTDIVKKFATESDMKRVQKTTFGVVLGKVNADHDFMTYEIMTGRASAHDRFYVDNKKRVVTRGYKYNLHTVKGDCGSLAMFGTDDAHTTSFGPRRVFGMHTGGCPSLGTGYCTVVTQEMLVEGLNELKEVRDDELPSGIISQHDDFPLEGSFLAMYRIEPVTHSANTKLQRTKLYEAWGPNTRNPAHLRPFVNEGGEHIDPNLVAMSKYNKPVVVYPQKEIDMVAHVAWKCITRATEKILDRGIYDFGTAVKGDDMNKYFKGLPRRTSAGYPFSTMGAAGKTCFFGKEGEYDLENDNCLWLEKEVYKIINKAKNNERSFFAFADFLKDERRSDKKNATGQTRLVSGAPLHYVIPFRMYFGRFCAALMETRIESGCCAGINVYQEWGHLKDHLSNHSRSVFAGDYSAFDASEQQQVHWAILDFINRWYDDGEENATVRRVLWMDLVNSRHICGGAKWNNIIYAWFHSLPSGHPATTMVNSLYNIFMFAYCWLKIKGLENLAKFDQAIRVAVLGDDNIVAVKEEFVDNYNQQTVTDAMTSLFMTYTSENKDIGVVAPIRDISEITFLKRAFVMEGKTCLGPLAMETIKEIPYWCRDKTRKEEITEDNVETALVELSAHTPDVWDEWSKKIVDSYYERMGKTTAGPPCREYYQAVFKNKTMDY